MGTTAKKPKTAYDSLERGRDDIEKQKSALEDSIPKTVKKESKPKIKETIPKLDIQPIPTPASKARRNSEMMPELKNQVKLPLKARKNSVSPATGSINNSKSNIPPTPPQNKKL